MKTNLSDERVALAIQMYLEQHCSSRQIGKVLNVSHKTVLRVLNAANMPKRNAGNYLRAFTDEQEMAICQEYVGDKKSSNVIAEKWGVDGGTIVKRIRRRGVARRTMSEAKRQYEVNEAAFDHVTEESAYWAGFLMGDGSVNGSRSSGVVRLYLAERDGEQVADFRAFLQSTHPLIHLPAAVRFNGSICQPQVGLEVTSRRLAVALGKFGVVPNKTHRACANHLEMNRDFWRGMVDADGSVRMGAKKSGGIAHPTPFVGMSGCAKQLMSQFADWATVVAGNKRQVRREKNNTWEIRFSNRLARKVIRALYGDCTVALARKWRTALHIIDRYASLAQEDSLH